MDDEPTLQDLEREREPFPDNYKMCRGDFVCFIIPQGPTCSLSFIVSVYFVVGE